MSYRKSSDIRGLLIILASLGLLALAVAYIFIVRFERGDVWPPYSTLRSDPIGTMALHESLSEIPGLTVTRNHKPFSGSKARLKGAVIIQGVRKHTLSLTPVKEVEALEKAAKEGARIIITMFPEPSKPEESNEKVDKLKEKAFSNNKDPEKAGKSKDNKEGGSEKKHPEYVSIGKRWGLTLDIVRTGKTPAPYTAYAKPYNGYVPVIPDRASPAGELQLKSALYFSSYSPGWRPVYKTEHGPVIVEKSLGRGSIVFSADTYFISNESLRKAPHTDVLLWLMGTERSIVFDEWHLGLSDRKGIAALLRQYGLTGVVLAFIVTALLFVWRQSYSLLPHREEPVKELQGRDQFEGFLRLLKRWVPQKDLITICADEWARTYKATGEEKSDSIKRRVKETANAPKARQNPVSTYRQIKNIIDERNPQ